MSYVSSTRIELTARDHEIVEVLTHKVRLLTVQQIARRWWFDVSSARSNAMRRLRRLEADGLVSLETVLARPELELTEPVLRWLPGNEEPDFVQLAGVLRNRWTKPVQPTSVVLATAGAKNRFGGSVGGYQPRATEWTHDVHVGAVCLWHERHRLEMFQHWVHEQQLRAESCSLFGDHVPDAMIRESTSLKPSLVVDFGGSYGKAKLANFHASAKAFSYEIW